MRIIAGKLGGRHFESPRGHRTHPMSDKVRGALFNALGDIEGLSVLDAFAGSGAVAFEAISRGAASAMTIDADKDAGDTILANIRSLGLDRQVKLQRRNAVTWSRENRGKTFDIVVLDPPYDDIKPKVLAELVYHTGPDGVVVLSWPGSQPVPEFEGYRVIQQKSYGDAQLAFYRART